MERFCLDERDIRLLREGPKSFGGAMKLNFLRGKYKKIMGIKDPEPPNCQSSFKEWNEQTKSV